MENRLKHTHTATCAASHHPGPPSAVGECLKDKTTPGGLQPGGLSTADPWLPTSAVDLFVYYKNNVSRWVFGVVLLRRGWPELRSVAGSPIGGGSLLLCRPGSGRWAARHYAISAHAGQKPAPAGSEAPDSRGWLWRGRWPCPGLRAGHQQQGSWGLLAGSNVRGWRAACSIQKRDLMRPSIQGHHPQPSGGWPGRAPFPGA